MKYKHLSVEEREIIERMLWEKTSLRRIAKIVGRSHSSIVREIRRCDAPGRVYMYKSRLGNDRALLKRKNRGRKDRLKNDAIRSYVIAHLKIHWSPEQISGRMKKEKIGNVSHEAIYQFIYKRVRNGTNIVKAGVEDLRPYLRRRRRIRLPRGARKCQRIFQPMGTSIDERPLVVDTKTRVGDWESDTVESCNHKAGVNTLLERKTGMYLVTKVSNRTSKATVEVLTQRLANIPAHTVTFDNGVENRDWRLLEERINIKTFFAHPYHSWERGANENANGLLREYFPKKTDFTIVPDEEIKRVEYALNTRPRKRLGWLTPLEAFSGAVRS
jgi:IS30 family transposase